MADTPKPPDDRLRAVMDALAESVAEAPDDEILAEAREESIDPSQRAESIRDMLFKAVDDFEAGRPAPAREPRPIPVQPSVLDRLRAWMPRPALGYALAALLVVAPSALVVYTVAIRDDRPTNVARVDPTPEPPRVEPPVTNADGGQTPNGPTNEAANPPPAKTEPRRPPRTTPLPEPPPDPRGTTRSPGSKFVPTANIRSIYIDLVGEQPSELARGLRDAVIAHIRAGGTFALNDVRNDADAGLRILESARGRFRFEFRGDEGKDYVLWAEQVTVKSPGDADREAGRIVLRMAETVQSAQQKGTGAGQ